MRRISPGAILMAVALSGFAAFLRAQDRMGAIAGRVADETSGALPGVSVEAAGPALATARVAVTDAQGAYRISDLPAGVYRVSFRLMGFQGVARDGLTVAPGSTASADATLHLSATADVVVTGRRTFRNLADVTEPGESLV